MASRDREEEQQETGFIVSDKRLFTKEGARREGSERLEPSRPEPPAEPPPRPAAPPRSAAPSMQEEPRSGAAMPPEGDVPPADFSTYVIMLANTVMMLLGQVPDPGHATAPS